MNRMRASDLKETEARWRLYKLPSDLIGQNFLDVGCWGGGFLVEAHNRGADLAVGVDSVRTLIPEVENVVTETKLDDSVFFYQMDIFSPHWFSLPRFDCVLCAGVLYHVPDPVGFLHRLKAVMTDKGVLYLETALHSKTDNISLYAHEDFVDNNWSNWFIPTAGWLLTVTQEIGLRQVDGFPLSGGRGVFKFELSNWMPRKFLPRKRGYMK